MQEFYLKENTETKQAKEYRNPTVERIQEQNRKENIAMPGSYNTGSK
jgi:hypothetical protein